MSNLLAHTLVESKRRGLGSSVVRHLSQAREASHTGDRHDVPVVILDHTGEELLDGPEMGERVDFQRQADLLFRFLQD